MSKQLVIGIAGWFVTCVGAGAYDSNRPIWLQAVSFALLCVGMLMLFDSGRRLGRSERGVTTCSNDPDPAWRTQ